MDMLKRYNRLRTRIGLVFFFFLSYLSRTNDAFIVSRSTCMDLSILSMQRIQGTVTSALSRLREEKAQTRATTHRNEKKIEGSILLKCPLEQKASLYEHAYEICPLLSTAQYFNSRKNLEFCPFLNVTMQIGERSIRITYSPSFSSHFFYTELSTLRLAPSERSLPSLACF